MSYSIPSINTMFLEIIINIVVISALVGYLVYIWRNSQKTSLLRYYLVMHSLAILVLFSNFIIKIAPSEPVKWICIIAACFIKACFDISFFCYGYYFLKRGNLSYKIILLVTAYPVLCLLMILSNQYHHLFITRLAIADHNYGILHHITSAMGYTFQFLGAILMCMFLIGKHKMHLYRLFIMAITLAAFTLQFIYTNNVLYSPIDINPILVFVVFTFLFIGVYRFGLLNTLSLGIIKSLEMFNDAVLVFDEKGETIHKNKACNMYDEGIINFIAVVCRNALKESSLIIVNPYKRQIELPGYDRILSVSLQPIKSMFKKIIGYVCIVHDDTAIVTGINDLEEKHEQLEEMNESIKMLAEDIKKLVVLEERNILAKDIHDVMGHSLNYALNVLESNKVIAGKKPEKAIQRLKQAVIDIDRGLGEIRTASLNENNGSLNSFSWLSKELRQMVKRLHEVGVVIEITAVDDLNGYNGRIYKTIYRVCQEAVTNSIKHGNASRVVISIKKRDNMAILHIVDNGKGCVSFAKGNGLSGMEERLKKIGGNVTFGSFDDNTGFLVHASIPLD